MGADQPQGVAGQADGTAWRALWKSIHEHEHEHAAMKDAVKKSLALAMSRNVVMDSIAADFLSCLAENHGYVLIHREDL